MAIVLNPVCGSCGCTAGNDILAPGLYTYADGLYRAGGLRITQAGHITDFVTDVGPTDLGILHMAYDGANGHVYLAGEFTEINGTTTRGIARVAAETGVVDPTWDPLVNGDVYGVIVVSGVVYFVGNFTTVGGVGRNNAAAVSTGGVLQAWNPNLDDVGKAIDHRSGEFYVGGPFTHCGATVRHGLAKFNAAGTLQAWDPNLYAGDLGSPPGSFPAEVYCIKIADSGGILYIGGYFSHVGGASGTVRHWAAAISQSTGLASAWDAALDDSPYAIDVDPWSGDVLMSGDFLTTHGQSRACAAVVDQNGNPTSIHFDFGGAGFGRACLFDGDGTTGTGNMYLGGRLYESTNTVRSYLVKFDPNGVRQTAWEPELDAEVFGIIQAT